MQSNLPIYILFSFLSSLIAFLFSLFLFDFFFSFVFLSISNSIQEKQKKNKYKIINFVADIDEWRQEKLWFYQIVMVNLRF